MWKLQNISAKNICTFNDFTYDVTSECATLIFGDNQDNGMQNSNGSGKSALLETISLALTGMTLRDVKTVDCIINDYQDFAEITATLCNSDENTVMVIKRHFERGTVQTISITENGTETVEASVADYNKYILDRLGLTKEELFSNFILSKQRFRPFLSVPDKDKKDIINTFSNGILVDQSIEAVREDIEPLSTVLTETEKKIAGHDGAIATLKTTIQGLRSSEKEAVLNKETRIKNWRDDIAAKRKEIRIYEESSKRGEERQILVEKTLVEAVEQIESGESSIKDAYLKIEELFSDNNIPPLEINYGIVVALHLKKLEGLKTTLAESEKTLKGLEKDLAAKQKAFDKYKKHHDKDRERNEKDRKKLDEEIVSLRVNLADIMTAINDVRAERKANEESIALLEAQLAGVITCPHCKKEFFLDTSKETPEVIKKKLTTEQQRSQKLDKELTSLKETEKKCVDEGVAKKNMLVQLTDKDDKNRTEYLKRKQVVLGVEENISELRLKIANTNVEIVNLSNVTQTTRADMFKDAYGILDDTLTKVKRGLSDLAIRIETTKGAIGILEENIKSEQDRSSSNADTIKTMEENIIKHEDAKLQDLTKKTQVESEINILKVQEANFNKFKTHLANSKISAIETITNEFLEMLGSDMRIVLSGYTTLKSGKVREKISVTLLRDGVDCGVFQKLSAGEQARIQLANILAMYQLTNQKCAVGKGLDLLVIDEVLDASDEDGLASVFAALNSLKITSLVVSHGNIAEGYEHRLIVQKSGGVSKLIY